MITMKMFKLLTVMLLSIGMYIKGDLVMKMVSSI